jgi:hypothetical protein
MATVLKFHRPHPPKSGANRSRPTASHILTNVAALLSRVERLEIQTTEDLRESFFILDLANMCIRLSSARSIVGRLESNYCLIPRGLISSLKLPGARPRIFFRDYFSQIYCRYFRDFAMRWNNRKASARPVGTQASRQHHRCRWYVAAKLHSPRRFSKWRKARGGGVHRRAEGARIFLASVLYRAGVPAMRTGVG